jgi:TetR/AcrR family transcriptional repressor of bet genes
VARPTNTKERRADIQEALLEVLAREGYRGATIAAVARQAGLNPGLLHYHFDRKLDILIALVERLTTAALERATLRMARAGTDPVKRLLAYVNAHVALGAGADSRAGAAWVAIGAEAIREPEVRAVYQAAVRGRLARLEELFRACLRERGRSTSGATRKAAAVLSAIEGAFQLSVGAPGALPKGFAAPALRQMILGLLADS